MNMKYEVLTHDKSQHIDDFYVNFKEKLEDTHAFPTNYMFKYIVPTEQSTIAKLHSIFENSGGSFSSRDSKTGKYTSITIKVPVNDATDVIIYYRLAAKIEGILML